MYFVGVYFAEVYFAEVYFAGMYFVEVYFAEVYFFEMYSTCVSSKLCKFIFSYLHSSFLPHWSSINVDW